ncbi:HupE/UreJ family protein [Labrenzia sp. PHM005]|uniref:HupE/UreJ family protein n=1 Tax=Labrenzia sp. PHM005 TaxID=2590016 RepID=UPI0011406908|nr:HupE/UreJ family protein [Labrenzia sp. PHM005]QDG78710.1 HupE/UreJ family protein [Labrenzia sp. PHM005]
MKILTKTAILVGAVTLAAGPAMAHTGSQLTVAGGLLHPVLGLDHLLALIGVGILAAQQRPLQTSWTLPAAFLAAVAAGSLAGFAGLTTSIAEPGTLVSLVVFGLLIAAGRGIGLPLTLGVTALFGLAHGTAHGMEAAGASAVYLTAFLASCAALHGLGYALGRKLEAVSHGRLAAGLAVGAGGLALALT